MLFSDGRLSAYNIDAPTKPTYQYQFIYALLICGIAM